jgi:phosphohistidine phosphatase
MLLTLVRHGDAEAPNNSLGDAGRCLSPHGREQARVTGQALAQQGVRLTHVWSSPLVRAVQTAELMLGALEFDGSVETRDDLYPDSSPRSLLQSLRELDPESDVLLVGHMPYMSALASELLGMHVGGFATGAALRVGLALPASTRATLVWRSRP